MENFAGAAPYDHGLGNCVALPNFSIEGERFETDCYQLGVKDGFHPVDPKTGYMMGDKIIKVHWAEAKCHRLPR